MIDRDRWRALAAGGGRVPVVRELVLDAAQPVALLARLRRGPFAFLLESAVGGERWARYTFLGTEPREAWRYAAGAAQRWNPEDGWQDAGACPDILGHVGGLLRGRREVDAGLPRFRGGAVGWFGYDVARTLERLPEGPPDDTGLPDALVMIADALVILDNLTGRSRLVVNVDVPSGASAADRDARYDAAQRRLDDWAARLSAPDTLEPFDAAGVAPAGGAERYPDARFLADVETIREHIARGDIFQAVLSRRVDVDGEVDALQLYRALRALNPAPYLYCLSCDDHAIVGSSPEVLVRLEDGEVTVRPIAGTRPRGGSPAVDAALAAELLADPKERAEHLMLVDLGRNDVGRVAAYGTVRVSESMAIERYAHVQHIVSEVRGTLAPGRDAVDVLRACFPAGTVSGAPKVRAMEILDGLEPVRRGPYAGAVGYMGWDAASLDTAIAIRTCVVLPGRVLVQAGAGIVADSVPARELAETQAKAMAALRAVALARRMGRQPR